MNCPFVGPVVAASCSCLLFAMAFSSSDLRRFSELAPPPASMGWLIMNYTVSTDTAASICLVGGSEKGDCISAQNRSFSPCLPALLPLQ